MRKNKLKKSEYIAKCILHIMKQNNFWNHFVISHNHIMFTEYGAAFSIVAYVKPY